MSSVRPELTAEGSSAPTLRAGPQYPRKLAGTEQIPLIGATGSFNMFDYRVNPGTLKEMDNGNGFAETMSVD